MWQSFRCALQLTFLSTKYTGPKMKYRLFFLEEITRSFCRSQFVGIGCGRPAIRLGIWKLIPVSCFIPLSGFLQQRRRPKAPRCLIMPLLPANIIIGRIETIEMFDIQAPILWTIGYFRNRPAPAPARKQLCMRCIDRCESKERYARNFRWSQGLATPFCLTESG